MADAHPLPAADWDEAEADRWERLADIRDAELWRARGSREALVAFARQRLRDS